MRHHMRGFAAAQIAHAAPAVDRCIAVEQLLPPSAARYANAIHGTHHRRELANDEHYVALVGFAQKTDDARLDITRIDPFEPRGAEIEPVERRLGPIDAVYISDPALDTAVLRIPAEIPVEGSVVVPFPPLPELTAHEQQLFARVRPHVTEQQAQIRKLLPPVTGHFFAQGVLAVHDFVMRQRQDEILSKRVDKRKRYAVLVIATKH